MAGALEGPVTQGLTHFDSAGRARMVDVGEKDVTHRVAEATGRVQMRPETAVLIRNRRAVKGDVLAVAQVAAIMAAKRTHELIPMCHPLLLTRIDVGFDLEESAVSISARVETRGQTGVEMEALTAVGVAALTIYDMVKSTDRSVFVSDLALWEKAGGKSGGYRRSDPLQPAEAPAAPALGIDDSDIDGIWSDHEGPD